MPTESVIGNLASGWHPESSAERILPIDIIRGLALFGVLIVNILGDFRLPLLEHILQRYDGLEGADRVVEILAAGVLEFKAITIFSFLFGRGDRDPNGARVGTQRERAIFPGQEAGLAAGIGRDAPAFLSGTAIFWRCMRSAGCCFCLWRACPGKCWC